MYLSTLVFFYKNHEISVDSQQIWDSSLKLFLDLFLNRLKQINQNISPITHKNNIWEEMKEFNINNNIICQVMKKVELIRILGLSIFFRSHGVNINKLLNQNQFCFYFFEKNSRFFFAREREREREISLRVILSLFLTFQRIEPHYYYKNDSYKKVYDPLKSPLHQQ